MSLHHQVSDPRLSRVRRKYRRAARLAGQITVLIGAPLFAAGCSAGAPSLVGVWQADDGSGVKTIAEDGSCTGMYYNAGQPLDIGGGMTCTLGSEEDDGAYLLVVRQPPNEASYLVRFDGNDTAVLMSQSGEPIVTLERQ